MKPAVRRRIIRGFSLVELVMVVMIVAVVSAIAIPRLNRGSTAAAESALRADLVALNKAIDLYAAEHNGDFPNTGRVASQLTLFTDEAGATSATLTGTHFYGPYVRTIPPQPLGTRKGNTAIATSDGPTVGWIYHPARGAIGPAGTLVGGAQIDVTVSIGDAVAQEVGVSQQD